MSEYLRIVLQNIEPVRIADGSTSQNGQTVTLRHIPGTAIRGLVVNALAKEKDFEEIKKTLFSPQIRYLNAYPSANREVLDEKKIGEKKPEGKEADRKKPEGKEADRNGPDGKELKELIPSLKGFYEDKTAAEGKKELQNVFTDHDLAGKKRAALGNFCYIDGDCIHYCSVGTGSDMKIKINIDPKAGEKQNVFRHEYIAANHVFTAYIAVDEPSLKDRIQQVFDKDVIIGNGRSAGLGKCRVLSCGYVNTLPFQEYLAKGNQEGSCYMMLLSHTAMRDGNGELCGLNMEELASQMGVTGAKIGFCVSSTVNVHGYNRTWGVKTPSAMMYEQGSVFRLEYTGTLTEEKMQEICDTGIGIRRNEGFGRVVFLENYEKIKYKEKLPNPAENRKGMEKEGSGKEPPEDDETLKRAAKCYYRNVLDRAMERYVVENPLKKGNLSNSQLGALESFATAYQYNPQEAKDTIGRYLGHAGKKEEDHRVQKERNSIKELRKYVDKVFGTGIEELLSVETKQADSIMGIPKGKLFTEEEIDRMKLGLITKMIRYDGKKEAENE